MSLLHRKKRRRRVPAKLPSVDEVHLVRVDPGAQPTHARIFGYDADHVEESDHCSLAQVTDFRNRFPVVWVDVTGLADLRFIEAIGAEFQLHALALEDVVHPCQRAKFEDYDSFNFFVMRMAPMEGEDDTDQLSMFLGDGWVVTFQEREGDDLNLVRQRIRAGKGRIRKSGPDYLAYALIDAAVDAYFPMLEKSGSDLEELEDTIVLYPKPEVLTQIYNVRRRLLGLRRAVWPLREALGSLVRGEDTRVTPDTKVFLRDVYDHSIQLIDLLENYRDLSSNLMDVYLSSMSNRMNEIMKVLTIITTIFIPLSFIAGVYGMNFNTQASRLNMPELNWWFGYPLCLFLMAVIAGLEIVYFKRKGWLGKGPTPLPTDDQ